MLEKATDPYIALLSYRTTPLANGYSPAELLMNRKLRSTVPMITKQYMPKVPCRSQLQCKEQLYQDEQKKGLMHVTELVSYYHCNRGTQYGFQNSKGVLRSSPKWHHVRTQYKLQWEVLGGIEDI